MSVREVLAKALQEIGGIAWGGDGLAAYPDDAAELAEKISAALTSAGYTIERGERVKELEADRQSLVKSINQAMMKVEAGQCSFSAESKHLFLKETMQILQHAETDAVRKALAPITPPNGGE